MKEHKKPSIIGPGAASLTLLLLLFIGSKENPQEKSDANEILMLICFLIFSVSVIWIWHKYLKEFVAFTIEEKLTEPNKKQES